MRKQREISDEAWETYRQLTEPDDPLDGYTSVLARVRHGFFRDSRWQPIWSDLDQVLESAALQAATTFDPTKGTLRLWFEGIARQDAMDARDKKFLRNLKIGNSAVFEKEPAPNPGLAELDLAEHDEAAAATQLTPQEQAELELQLFAQLAQSLPGWLSPPIKLDFVRDFVATVQGLSRANQRQMYLDEQLFCTEQRRTTSDDLQQLALDLGMTPVAIRAARARIRARLRAVFVKHGMTVPRPLADRGGSNET